MAITDAIFLFFFLPVSLVLYFGGREKLRNYILLALSLLFYACGAPEYFLLLIISLTVNITLGWMLEKAGKKTILASVLLITGIGYNIVILGYYKYFDFITSNINTLFSTGIGAKNLILPLGLSFFTFKAISYLADVYQGKIEVGHNPVYAAVYLSFFGQMQSGPLSRYNDMYDIARGYTLPNKFSEGACRFIIGFNKKILLSNTLARITEETFAAVNSNMSVSYAWLGAVCYSLQLFFDFSGYSDMAIGLSKMFGFECPENFRYPYMTASVSEFWRRWHITLGSWFRDYVYIPLGGSRVSSKIHLYMNLFAVWTLTGIWHGASWNFVFWGIAYFVVIAFEKTTGWPDKFKSKLSKAIYRAFTLLFINFQWVIFRANGLDAGIEYIKNMFFAPKNSLADARAMFLLRDNKFFIMAAVVLCFPIVPVLENYCKKKGKYAQFLCENILLIVNIALFLLAVSFVVAGQNNPFAYANF